MRLSLAESRDFQWKEMESNNHGNSSILIIQEADSHQDTTASFTPWDSLSKGVHAMPGVHISLQLTKGAGSVGWFCALPKNENKEQLVLG